MQEANDQDALRIKVYFACHFHGFSCGVADVPEAMQIQPMAKKTRSKRSQKKNVTVQQEFALLARRLQQLDTNTDSSRRERGLRQLTETVGVQGGQVLNQLVAFSPDLTRFIVDFAYGDIISREGLDARTRALVVVAALAAIGNAQPQLETHVGSAINSGCTREEILEVLLVVAVYAGFPAALNGMTAARAALEK